MMVFWKMYFLAGCEVSAICLVSIASSYGGKILGRLPICASNHWRTKAEWAIEAGHPTLHRCIHMRPQTEEVEISAAYSCSGDPFQQRRRNRRSARYPAGPRYSILRRQRCSSHRRHRSVIETVERGTRSVVRECAVPSGDSISPTVRSESLVHPLLAFSPEGAGMFSVQRVRADAAHGKVTVIYCGHMAILAI